MSRKTRKLTKARDKITSALSLITEAVDTEENTALLSKAKDAIWDALNYYTAVGPYFYKNDVARDMEDLHEYFDEYAENITEDDCITKQLSRIEDVISRSLEQAERNSENGIEPDGFDSSNEESHSEASSDDEADDQVLPTISPDELIAKIENYLQLIEATELEDAENALQEINQYFAQPNYVHGAVLSTYGSVSGIQNHFAAKMLKASFVNFSKGKKYDEINEQGWQTLAKGMSLLAYRFKFKMAYRHLLNGKKFKLAGLPKLVEPYNKEKKSSKRKRPLSLPNPIELQSRQNIKKLIADLKEGEEKTHQNGLRDDEVELFEALCELPFYMQNATNFFFPIVNAGRFKSYAEINRHDPNYQSDFSTKGNVDILGNNGFLFFRVFVDPINNTKTRYGDTAKKIELALVKKGGWISLHDELNPFPQPKNRADNPRQQGADYATEKVVYRSNNVLRMSKAVAINAGSDKRTLDGIEYRYRKSQFKSSSTREAQKLFEKNSQPFKQSFTEEIFYGPNILPGIALSVIRELRRLRECGYRKTFLDEFKIANPAKKTQILGKLIKDLFRIEGKYPVGLEIKKVPKQQAYTFSPIGASNYQPFEVINPSGDGRFNPDVSINEEALALAKAKDEARHVKSQLSLCRQQLGRKNASPETANKKIDLEKKEKEVKEILDKDKQDRASILKFYNKFKIDRGLLDKIDTPKLALIKSKFAAKIENKEHKPEDLIILSTKELNELLNHDIHQLTQEGKKDSQATVLDDDFKLLDLDDERSASLSTLTTTKKENVKSPGSTGQVGLFAPIQKRIRAKSSNGFKQPVVNKIFRPLDGKYVKR